MKLKRNEYLQVVGLLALCPQHIRSLKDIEVAICKIVGEKPDGCGHVADAVYSEYPAADTLLEKLGARRKLDAKGKRK